MIGAVVGCALPPAGSTVMPTCASPESPCTMTGVLGETCISPAERAEPSAVISHSW